MKCFQNAYKILCLGLCTESGMTVEFVGEHFDPQAIENKAKYLESSAPKKKEKPENK